MLELSKIASRIVMLLLIMAVPVWSQEESAQEELGPDERKALEIVQQILEAGEFASQDDAYEKVLSSLAAELGEGHPLVLRTTQSIAIQQYQEGRYHKARQLFEQLVDVSTEIEGEDHPSTLSALNNLAVVLQAQGKLPDALAIKKQVFLARSAILGDEHPDTLTAKANLASTLFTLGNLANARTRFEEVLLAQSKILGDEHPDTLKAKASLGVSLAALGDLTGARTHFEEVLLAQSRVLGYEHLDTLTTKANLAGILRALGDLFSAQTHFEEVLLSLIWILGDNHPNTLTTKANLAANLSAMGDLAGARTRFEEVLLARSRILGKDHPNTLTTKANLATTLFAQGDLAGARTRFEEVLQAQGRILGDEHPDTLTTKADLAVTLKALGDLAGAKARQEEVLAAFSRILGDKHPDTLKAKTDLAVTLANLGDFAGALDRQRQIFGTRSRFLGMEHPDTLLALHNLATTYENMGEFEQARSSYALVIQTHREAQGDDYFPATESEAKTLLGLGRVHQATGQLNEAQEAFGLALDAIEAQTERLDLSEETRRRYRASFQRGYHSALAVAKARRDTGLALHLSERYRAGNLRSLRQTQSPESLAAMPAEIEQQLRDIAVEYDWITRQLDGLHPKRDPTKHRSLVDRQIELRREREVIQSRWLREQLKHRDQAPTLDVPEVKSQLDPGTALLIYNVGQDQTQLLVLFREGEPEARSIELSRSLLYQQVTRFRELVAPDNFKGSVHESHESSDPEARVLLGRWLYSQLIPSDPRLESAERWLILSDGPLHMLPFDALIRPEDVSGTWHFLAQHKPLHTVQSLATYADLRDRRRDDFRFVENNLEKASWIGFGDPIYPVKIADLGERQAKDNRRILRIGEERAIFDGMSELPDTEREIRGISNLLPEGVAQAYLGAAATEEQAWSDLAQADMIHFATHGVALPHLPQFGMDPMDSFLALSLFDEDELQRRKLQHNGLLQAWEIIDLKLKADLVVLSACQTALGQDQGGDGLISLSRAFQIAGARSVLASLWAVNDRSTAEFMIRFYQHLIKGEPKDIALQNTQQEFIDGPIEITEEDGKASLHDFSHPYYWAAFQLIGDWQ